jgi:hypothetical protein
MPISDIFFSTVVGGYPQAVNGSTAAITNNSSEFYIDAGKNAAYATMEVSEPTVHVPTIATINKLSIVLLNCYGSALATVQAEIWNNSNGAYTTALVVDPPDNAANIEIVPDSFPLWNTTWEVSDLLGIKVRLSNPNEPSGGIALRSTFIYLAVDYSLPPGKIILNDGKVFLKGGKIEL